MSDARVRTPKLLLERGDLRGVPLSPTDGFVLSRVDGASSEQEIIASTGMPFDQISASLAKLESLGVIAFEAGPPPRARSIPAPRGPSPAPPAAPQRSSPPSATSQPSKTSRRSAHSQPEVASHPSATSQPTRASQPSTPSQPTRASQPSAPSQTTRASQPSAPSQPAAASEPGTTSQPTRSSQASAPSGPARVEESTASLDPNALAEDVDLDVAMRRRVLETHRTLDHHDYYALLGVERGVDKKAVKRAYFDLAARFHPDRYFRKRLGSYKLRIESIFGRITLAHDTLTHADKRAEYDAYLEEQRQSRGIEALLADAALEAKRAEESIERELQALESEPVDASARVFLVSPDPASAANGHGHSARCACSAASRGSRGQHAAARRFFVAPTRRIDHDRRDERAPPALRGESLPRQVGASPEVHGQR